MSGRRTGEIELIFLHYRAALRLDPQRTTVMVDMGVCYFNLSQFDTADSLWKQALRIDPNLAQALFNLGFLNENKGDLETAPIDATGKHVVVIGGGDTGADCVGTAHRQRAASVTQLEILPMPPTARPAGQPWPTYPMTFKVTSAHEEGGERIYAVSTRQFLDDGQGRLRGLEIVEVEFTAGRFEPVAGTERELAADLVFLAMGFTGPERGALLEQLDVELDERGNVVRDLDYMTSVDGVFAAGDAGRGQSLIVWAIAEGRSAAASVDRWLTGATNLPSPIPPTARQLLV